jgi:uncharacterized protein
MMLELRGNLLETVTEKVEAGETELSVLLAGMNPVLADEEFVFCSFPKAVPLELAPIGSFREPEGTTAIVPREVARRAGVPYIFPCRMISLTIHSALTAVGLLAAISRKLAAQGISINAVSAYYHDHLFVPVERAEDAMRILHGLMQQHAAALSPPADTALAEGRLA